MKPYLVKLLLRGLELEGLMTASSFGGSRLSVLWSGFKEGLRRFKTQSILVLSLGLDFYTSLPILLLPDFFFASRNL